MHTRIRKMLDFWTWLLRRRRLKKQAQKLPDIFWNWIM